MKVKKWNQLKTKSVSGSLGGAAVWRLPLARGVILETRDRIPRQAPSAWSLLLPLPMSLPLSESLCLSRINKILKKTHVRVEICQALG